MRFFTYLVRAGQTIWDIAIQHYGSVEGVWLLTADNEPLDFDTMLADGDGLRIRESPADCTDCDLTALAYFRKLGIEINNGDDACDNPDPFWYPENLS